jgi:AmmeMemoRadiSam system protein A
MDIAFAAIEKAVGASPMRKPPGEPDMDVPHNGVFVTVFVRGKLRGCIGYLDASMPLCDAISKAAASAAVQDPRFDSVTPAELAEMEIEISLLGARERIYHAEQIEIGTHGIMLEHGYARGLLLPQVAPEYGWDALDFLRALCRKAGVPGHTWKDQEARLFRFSSVIHRQGYLDHRSAP